MKVNKTTDTLDYCRYLRSQEVWTRLHVRELAVNEFQDGAERVE